MATETIQNPGAITTGQAKIAVTGTAIALSSGSVPASISVIFSTPASNAAPICIGPSGVSNLANGSGNGFIIPAGQSTQPIVINNLNLVYANGTANDVLSWVVV